MNPRRLGMISAVICVAVAVAALEFHNTVQPEPQTQQLTAGDAPLVPIGNPDDVFDIIPQGSSADYALLLEPAGAESNPGGSSTRTDRSAPPELPQSEPQAHVPLMSGSRKTAIEEVIRRHLPLASDHERQCWLEETCGLSEPQVEELLRLRTEVGPLVSPPTGSHNPPTDEQRPSFGVHGVLTKARRIVLGNLMNADSVGHRAAEITFVANDAARGGSVPAIASITISTMQGELITTGRSLDVAVEGKGFLQVSYDGQARLTRFGRLTIGTDRKLALDVTGAPVYPSPQIEIPSDASAVRILNGGQLEVARTEKAEWLNVGTLTLVAVPFPEHLRPAESGTYEVTPQSGEPLKIVPGAESGSVIRPGMLEKSNVNFKAELQRLEQLDCLREQLVRTQSLQND